VHSNELLCFQCVFVGVKEQPEPNRFGRTKFINEIKALKETAIFFGASTHLLLQFQRG